MSGIPVRRPAAYEDLLAVPDHLVGEIIDGELVTSPRPATRHIAAASALGDELGPPFRRGRGGPGGWVILDEPELHIVEQIMVPDLAGWRRDRMPEIPDAAFFDLRPDWVCEVLSPSTAALDRTRKWHHYAQAGVNHLWFLDPAPRTLEVYQLDLGTWRLLSSTAGDILVRAVPFDAVEIDLAAVWAR
ncbi:MAG TPA: Uma2 family endonuclease [Polyangia bacterium]|jgi:Uma2 family endonuclease